jgi:hypothetical protein
MKFSKISCLITLCAAVCLFYICTTSQYEVYTMGMYLIGAIEFIEYYISGGMSGPIVLYVNQGIIGFSKYKIKEYHQSFTDKKQS